jgi:hypothetical protein
MTESTRVVGHFEVPVNGVGLQAPAVILSDGRVFVLSAREIGAYNKAMQYEWKPITPIPIGEDAR